VAFSPNGALIAGGGDDGRFSGPTTPWTVKIWDVRTGQLVRTLAAHGNHIRTVKFSPTGKILATGGYDNTVKLWEVKNGALLRTLPHKDGVSSIDFSPDGKTLAAGCDDGNVRLWNLDGLGEN
jgi:WD40 repeat protein